MGTSARRIRKALEQLPIPDPWDRDRFVEHVAALRGRPITLVPIDVLGVVESPCGLWLLREHDDIIVYEGGTSEYHIDQIVCHEVGHMVLGHDRAYPAAADGPPGDAALRSLLPDIDPAAVRAVLGRSGYGNGMEREAELFASMVMVSSVPGARRQNLRNVLFRQQ
ncbi:hypothetical protein [Nocardia wallacei]|uniref:hypothetical protein n=1 Tax=Nocardia wallacei TaxID=480035 RepID=UPI003CC7CC9F